MTEKRSEMTFSYKYSTLSCSTGERKFYSEKSFCKGLQNNTLNNNCAITFRKIAFKTTCSGTFEPFDGSREEDRPEEIYGQNETSTLIRKLGAGQASMVSFINQNGDFGQSIVLCEKDATSAVEILRDQRTGGIILARGSQMVFKNNKSAWFRDGSRMIEDYIQIECR